MNQGRSTHNKIRLEISITTNTLFSLQNFSFIIFVLNDFMKAYINK